MKERMKKLTLLVFYRDKAEITSALQELGVIHLETVPVEESGVFERLENDLAEWQRALHMLDHYKDHGTRQQGEPVPGNPEDLREQILEYDDALQNIHHHLEGLRKEENLLKPWGEFSWEKIAKLEAKGVYLEFCQSGKKELQQFEFGESVPVVIFESGGITHFVVISYGQKPELPFEHMPLPHKSLSKIAGEKKEAIKEQEEIAGKVSILASGRQLIVKGLRKSENTLSMEIANHSYAAMGEGKIMRLTGWFPEKIEQKVEGILGENNLTYLIEDPSPGDKVPVILHNQKYPRIFESITKIFQLPNYYEFDLTPMIAVFYPIFFGYCLGDAGYGVVLIIISVIGAFTFLKKARNVAALIFVLGLMTAVVGIIKSGTLFGIPIAERQDIPFFAELSKYILINDDQDYIFNAFNVALMIGVVQIIVAVIINIVKNIRYKGMVYALGGVGKLIIIVSTITLFLGSIQKMTIFLPYTGLATVTLLAGIVMVLLFHDPSIPLLRRVGGGVLPLYFIFTGLLGDVLSYIRLFALGVASSILGLVVNQIGMQMMDGAGPVVIGLSVIFLIFGHSLNLALASLGAFVHPLRLTFVEFYNNAGFEGGGVPYSPFRKEAT
jgi:V/A-type H+/Na+-transporting ATPase subunit I